MKEVMDRINDLETLAILNRYQNVCTPNDHHVLSAVYDIESGGAGMIGPMVTPMHIVCLLAFEEDDAKEALERLRLLMLCALHPDGCYRLTTAGYYQAKLDIATFQDAVEISMGGAE